MSLKLFKWKDLERVFKAVQLDTPKTEAEVLAMLRVFELAILSLRHQYRDLAEQFPANPALRLTAWYLIRDLYDHLFYLVRLFPEFWIRTIMEMIVERIFSFGWVKEVDYASEIGET